jgi:anthranilate phosphoribosyltransferase
MPLPDQILEQVLHGHHLNESDAYAAFSALMDGQCTDIEIAALLTALRMKGEAVAELVGAARAMQERATPIPTRHTRLLDTCGTGGDRLGTFNISTATAIVVAAGGVAVPKHGNRSASSATGSADVLEQLGVNIHLTPERITHSLDELGIGFCFAPTLHGAMKHAASVRKQLRFRTIFNLLGPLTNPARAEFQLVGAGRSDLAEKLAEALCALGRRRALVVCGANQLDEVSLWGTTLVLEVADGQICRHQWTAASFGLPECSVAELQIDTPAQSAEVIRRILAGQPGPARNIVVANAAAGYLAAGHESGLPAAVARAEEVLDTGKAAELLQRLVELTQTSVERVT